MYDNEQNNIMIHVLEKEFLGTGEVAGMRFVQLQFNDKGFIYAVFDEGVRHFEVFERKTTPLCIDFEKRLYSDTEKKEMYPRAKDFGVWAWTFRSLKKAVEKFESL
jgi:hypothetical protein